MFYSKTYHKITASGGIISHLDVSVMIFYNLFTKVESQTGAFGGAGGFIAYAVKLFKYPFLFIIGYAGAFILYLKQDGLAFFAQFTGDKAFFGGIFDGIFNKVVYQDL